jgi:hypothetical protein
MSMFLITATVAIATLVVALIADVSLTKFFSSASASVVDGTGVGRGKPPPEPACWDDKSGQPHCHA